MNELAIVATWRHGRLTLAQYASKVVAFMADLRLVDPIFRDGMRIMADTEKGSPLLPADLIGFEATVMHWAWDRNAPWVFEPMNPQDNSPYPESTFKMGYGLTFFRGARRNGDWMTIAVSAGRDNTQSNVCTFLLPNNPRFRDPALQRRLLATILAHWPTDYTRVGSPHFLMAAKLPPEATGARRSWMRIGWMTYIRRQGIAEALPPGTQVEPFGPPPGVLITLKDDGPPGGPEQLAESIRIRDSLYQAGLLVDPSWTPFEEMDRRLPPLREKRGV